MPVSSASPVFLRNLQTGAPGLDGLAGLGGLAVDEDAARVGHLVCHRAALDEPRNFQIFV